jgi:hypothetical protein
MSDCNKRSDWLLVYWLLSLFFGGNKIHEKYQEKAIVSVSADNFLIIVAVVNKNYMPGLEVYYFKHINYTVTQLLVWSWIWLVGLYESN